MAKTSSQVWRETLERLQDVLSDHEFSTWLRPLKVNNDLTDDVLCLFAPNIHIAEYVSTHFDKKIAQALKDIGQVDIHFKCQVDSSSASVQPGSTQQFQAIKNKAWKSQVNKDYRFDNFVEGKSNQLAYAMAKQVSDNPGTATNPVFIYGRVGLGKTHLMCAIGNEILNRKPEAKVFYIHANEFVKEMINALQKNTMDQFKAHYHNLDALLIDDIQFISGKSKTQEEFFHTFNSLFECKSQIILTCDRFPRELENIEERLRSRFSWGLTAFIEPPELETRVIILRTKAEERGVNLPDDCAFFIAQNIHGNVRDLEGALNTVIANARLLGQTIDSELTRMSLRDQLAVQARLITIENIQKITADFYGLRLIDILSKKRNRSIARPRQMAMALSKELTKHSLPEIGDAFGGRDHTTVLHACRKIIALRKEDIKLDNDWTNLINRLRN